MAHMALEERIAALEGSYRELSKRLDDLLEETHRGFDGVRAEINTLQTEMRSHFRWVLSLILVNWLSIMAGILLVAARQ
jgi:hypothetical protein